MCCQQPLHFILFFDVVNLHDFVILFVILNVQKLLYMWVSFWAEIITGKWRLKQIYKIVQQEVHF